ncbi:MAG: TIR domain-containing protein [Hyphomicrobiaceae bacterium]
MADVFLSYRNTPDRRAIVRRLATILRAYGVTVWWDYGLEAGESYRSQIMTELANARIVAPLWCAESVRSPWVRMEAELGKDKLIPGRLQKVPPPDAFEAIQAADLIGWDGAVGSPRLQEFVRLVCKRLDRPAAAPTDLIEELAELPPVKPLPDVAPAVSPRTAPAGSSRDYASGERQRLPIMIVIMIVGGLMAFAAAYIGNHYLGLPFFSWVTINADLPPKKSPEVQDAEKRAAEAQRRHEEALATAKRQEEQARVEAEANKRKLDAARAAAELEAVKRRAQEEAEAESRRRKLAEEQAAADKRRAQEEAEAEVRRRRLEAERAAAELEAAQRRRREAAEAERLERARRVQEWRKANGGCDPPLRRQCMTVGPTGGGPQETIGCVCM